MHTNSVDQECVLIRCNGHEKTFAENMDINVCVSERHSVAHCAFFGARSPGVGGTSTGWTRLPQSSPNIHRP